MSCEKPALAPIHIWTHFTYVLKAMNMFLVLLLLLLPPIEMNMHEGKKGENDLCVLVHTQHWDELRTENPQRRNKKKQNKKIYVCAWDVSDCSSQIKLSL